MSPTSHLFSSIIALFAMGVAGAAQAWGNVGHRVIAEVAEGKMCSDAMAKSRDLLSLERHAHLMDVSSWADSMKVQLGNRGPSHALFLPPQGGRFKPARDCAHVKCVIPFLTAYKKTLSDKKASAQSRLEALKFIVHLVGDLHQPFHGTRDGRRQVKVAESMVGLHAYWDSGLFKAASLRQGQLIKLVKQRASEIEADLALRGPVQWAEESRDIARDEILANLGPPGTSLSEATPAQLREDISIAVTRMATASVRLASLLDSLLGCKLKDK